MSAALAEIFPVGGMLADELDARGWTQAEFAESLGRPAKFVSEIISGKKEITRESAAQIAAALGTSPQMWLTMQDRYYLSRLDAARRVSTGLNRRARAPANTSRRRRPSRGATGRRGEVGGDEPGHVRDDQAEATVTSSGGTAAYVRVLTMMIRAASQGDGPAIGVVVVRGWQAAYRGLIPQDFLDGLDPARRGHWWQKLLAEGLSPREAVLVADVDGEVVGFVAVGPFTFRNDDQSHEGGVRALYLLPERWGQGMGRDLMAAGLQRLHGSGFEDASLWVLDSNERARRFYERGGWRADGETQLDDSFGPPLREVRYRRQLP